MTLSAAIEVPVWWSLLLAATAASFAVTAMTTLFVVAPPNPTFPGWRISADSPRVIPDPQHRWKVFQYRAWHFAAIAVLIVPSYAVLRFGLNAGASVALSHADIPAWHWLILSVVATLLCATWLAGMCVIGMWPGTGFRSHVANVSMAVVAVIGALCVTVLAGAAFGVPLLPSLDADITLRLVERALALLLFSVLPAGWVLCVWLPTLLIVSIFVSMTRGDRTATWWDRGMEVS